MTETRVTRTVQAPADRVFRTVSDIREFARAVPDVLGVEFLSEARTGVGTRFRETRRFGKREAATELEVTELEENVASAWSPTPAARYGIRSSP